MIGGGIPIYCQEFWSTMVLAKWLAWNYAYLAPRIGVFCRRINMSTIIYSVAGSVANAVGSSACNSLLSSLSQALTSRKHCKSRQSSMLGLKPLKQRCQRQDIAQRVKEASMYKRKCIQPIHCKHSQSAPAFPPVAVEHSGHTRLKPDLFWY
jgi:hypothetical protein